MARPTDNPESPPGDLDLTALYASLAQLYSARSIVGSAPPTPATGRGRAGAVLVRMVRRALFWFWPQLDAFHAATVEFARRQVSIIEQFREHIIIMDEELYRIRNQVAGPSLAADADLWLETMKCQARLEALRREVSQLDPSLKQAE